jgi:hypothetical protein
VSDAARLRMKLLLMLVLIGLLVLFKQVRHEFIYQAF